MYACVCVLKTWSAYHLHGKTDYSDVNSNGTVHFGEIFLGKSNAFRGIAFFPIQTEFPEISVPFVNNLIPGFLRQNFREEMQDISKSRIKWYGSIRSLFLERNCAVLFVQIIPREIPFKR